MSRKLSDGERRILNEMNQDARPSKKEQAEMARDFLRENGCHICGEDNPDKLKREMPYIPDCKINRRQMPDPQVVCKEEHPSKEDRRRMMLEESDETKVLFECGVVEGVIETDDKHPARNIEPVERIPANCRCGAEIEEVYY